MSHVPRTMHYAIIYHIYDKNTVYMVYDRGYILGEKTKKGEDCRKPNSITIWKTANG